MNTTELLAATVILFGDESQKAMAIEECSELINALCKERRGRVTRKAIITEIADVQIMCAQLAMMYREEKVKRERARKEQRLFARLQESKDIAEDETLEFTAEDLSPEDLTSAQLVREIFFQRQKLEQLTKEYKRREDEFDRLTDLQTGNYKMQL